jgi:hypothetical protein
MVEPGDADAMENLHADIGAPAAAGADAGISVARGLQTRRDEPRQVPPAPLDLEVLHALWDEIDFLEALDQADSAAQALQAFVQHYPRASQAPYLRWWALARAHGLDTESVRRTYEEHYGQSLTVTADNADLEDDRVLLAEIVSRWPHGEVLALIERSLAADPGDSASPVQVRAWRVFDDLLTLHGVLRHMVAPAVATVSANVQVPAQHGAVAAGADGLDFDLTDWLPPVEASRPPGPPRA